MTRGPPAARGSAGELSSSIQQPHAYHHPTLHSVRKSSTTGKMAEPIVQTIHRDPALLYVQCAGKCSPLVLTVTQLVDSAPHHGGYGMILRIVQSNCFSRCYRS